MKLFEKLIDLFKPEIKAKPQYELSNSNAVLCEFLESLSENESLTAEERRLLHEASWKFKALIPRKDLVAHNRLSNGRKKKYMY